MKDARSQLRSIRMKACSISCIIVRREAMTNPHTRCCEFAYHTQTRQKVRRDLNPSDVLRCKFRWNDKKIHMQEGIFSPTPTPGLSIENWNLSSQSSLLASVFPMRSRSLHTTTRYQPRFCLRSGEKRKTHGT